MKPQEKKASGSKPETPPASAKKLFKVLERIKHDGKLYKAGDRIDLSGVPKAKIEQLKKDGFIDEK